MFYDLQATPPAEVLLPFAIADAEVKAEWLTEKRAKKVDILVPQRGPRRALVELARDGTTLVLRDGKRLRAVAADKKPASKAEAAPTIMTARRQPGTPAKAG